MSLGLGWCGAFLWSPHHQGERQETSHLTSRRERAISLVLDPLVNNLNHLNSTLSPNGKTCICFLSLNFIYGLSPSL